jgi:hypothetical protein
MEALLSLSFDNLSSYDASKIRKGLRQVEGLLAQICLSNPSRPSTSDRRRSIVEPGKEPPPRKTLSELPNDAAFREFFRLQEGFEWNVAMRLVTCLDRLMGKSNDGQSDILIIQTLDLIQGILLLHPPSRSLFSRELYMNVCTPTAPSFIHLIPLPNLNPRLISLHSTSSTFLSPSTALPSNPPLSSPSSAPSLTPRKTLVPSKLSTVS